MSNQYINFYYDPSRQGYDTQAWSLVDGVAPVVNGGRLVFNFNAIIHYADMLRGDFVFNLNVPHAPQAGDNRIFGLYQYSKGTYLTFNISGTTFSANSGDGNGNTNSVTITWQTAWSAADTEFRIKWEAGLAHFYVGGVQQAVISDISVTGDPMSLYVANTNPDNLYLKYVDAKGIQSFYMNTPLVGSQTFGRLVLTGDSLTISESVTPVLAILVQNLITDTLTISESVSLASGVGFLMGPPNVSDVLTISESVTTGYGAGFLPSNPSISEALTISESVTASISDSAVSAVDTLTYSDTLSLLKF